MLFNLEVEMEMCTLGKQGCSSAVLRAEEGGHFLLISCLPVSMSHKPNQFVCIHSHHSYMGCLYLFSTVTVSPLLCLFLLSCLLLPARETLWIRAPSSCPSTLGSFQSVSALPTSTADMHLQHIFVQFRVPVSPRKHLCCVIISSHASKQIKTLWNPFSIWIFLNTQINTALKS